MAYMSQEKKKALTPAIKEICKKHGINATIAVNHHSTLVLNIKSGCIDFGHDHHQVNPYWYREHFADNDAALDFLSELVPAMNDGNWNRSDSSVDYFDVGWYIDINIGNWGKPYQLMEMV
jgi:hypothetical protein